MSGRPRRPRRAPPAPAGQWEVRFSDAAAAKGWESLAQQARENTYKAWVVIRTDPRPRTETPRHHRLKGGLAHVMYRGQTCEQWQIEVTSGGRVWYLVDTARETCWITFAGAGHPRATDRR
ncbi:hypothetical protein [Streptomyces sp. NPDC005805]|uniref:hypothetical protein n=1 Tax=Streptomyces sp. NPDC005805 TaxID=3157068 RepID=UPI0033DEC114